MNRSVRQEKITTVKNPGERSAAGLAEMNAAGAEGKENAMMSVVERDENNEEAPKKKTRKIRKERRQHVITSHGVLTCYFLFNFTQKI